MLERNQSILATQGEKIMVRNFKRSVAVLVILVLAASTYAFAAANTIEASAVGYAASVVGGYTVTNIIYDLDDANPTIVDEITFNINPTSGVAALEAQVVMIQTTNAGAWKVCSLVPGVAPDVAVTCTFPADALTAASITALNVSASSTTNPAD
jgi:hypothetical protein